MIFFEPVADLVRMGATGVALGGLDSDELGDLVPHTATFLVGEVVGVLEGDRGNPLFAEHLLRFWSECAATSSRKHTSGVRIEAVRHQPPVC